MAQKAFAILVFLLVSIPHVTTQTLIANDEGELVLEVMENTQVKVRMVDATGKKVGKDMALVTQDMLDMAIEKCQNDTRDAVADMLIEYATIADLSAVSSRVDENTDKLPVGLDAKFDLFDKKVASILEDISEINSELNDTVKHCPMLPSPSRGSIVYTPESTIPGVTATYQCPIGYVTDGEATRICSSDQTWTGTEPTCVPAPDPGSSSLVPEPSCREIYDRFRQFGRTATSGKFFINPNGVAMEVYCDMDTPASPTNSTLRGWTLCGKYDVTKQGTKRTYLRDGFARGVIFPQYMRGLDPLPTGVSQPWASIDCRKIIDGSYSKTSNGATHMMHAAANVPTVTGIPKYDAVRFTNIMADAQKDATLFFDTKSEDTGLCVSRDNGGITTYDENWKDLGTEDSGSTLGDGNCMLGNGHHFCSNQRVGSRFSNAGSNKQCDGSFRDTVYWAFYSDDHGCNVNLRIGTGCNNLAGSTALGLPSYRVNFLFVN
eukprot:m.78713 g.78713  ORF g.78713 m.78713 type:complete len:490 (-) comp12685_c0_seq2:132-1601(-)